MSTNYYVFCTDFPIEDGGPGCCQSCHEDEYEGHYDMPDLELPDGKGALVCCKVHTWLQEKYEKPALDDAIALFEEKHPRLSFWGWLASLFPLGKFRRRPESPSEPPGHTRK